ncbi:MAG: hypothetical protein ACTS79_00395 [Arsenophonus sp. ET-KM2-MAG3]
MLVLKKDQKTNDTPQSLIKDHIENIMIVDLLCNNIGKIAILGIINVLEFFLLLSLLLSFII